MPSLRLSPQRERRLGVVPRVPQQAMSERPPPAERIRETRQGAGELRTGMYVHIELAGTGVVAVQEAQEIAGETDFAGIQRQHQPGPHRFLVQVAGGDPHLEQGVASFRHRLRGDPQVTHLGECRIPLAGTVQGAHVVAATRGAGGGLVVVEIDLPVAPPDLSGQPLAVKAFGDGRLAKRGAQFLRSLGAHGAQASLFFVIDEVGAQRVFVQFRGFASIGDRTSVA